MLNFQQMSGSPANQYGLAATNFITHVNGVPTNDLDAFLAVANKIPDNTYFRLKLSTFDNIPWVATVKKNEHYFPTVEFVRDPGEENSLGWRKIVHKLDADGKGANGLEAIQTSVGDNSSE
jgi:pro-apoptotic serine protease NMA111